MSVSDQRDDPHAPWVLISANFHEQGGQARAVAALADYLLGQGRPVHLVAHEIDDRFAANPGVTFHPVSRPGGADFLGSAALRRRGRAIARQVTGERPDARVLSSGGCCDWPDVNWVHYVHHAWDPPVPGAPVWFKLKNAIAMRMAKRHERSALRSAKLVIANSQRTADDVTRFIGVPGDRIETVYCGCDADWVPPTSEERAAALDWLGQPSDRPLAVFVGGFGHDERKGFDTLWSAWKDLCADPEWDADLIAAGGGKGLTRWQQRTAEAGLNGRIRYLGFTDRIFDVLAAADVLISPVRYEAYGLNVQEAICRGVPAVVSADAGVAEQYSAELAELLLRDPLDANELQSRLRIWRADIPGWRGRVAELSESIRSFSWHQMAERIVASAERILACM